MGLAGPARFPRQGVDRALIGYQALMAGNRAIELAVLLAVTAGLAGGLSACGSDDADSSRDQERTEVTPKQKAPASAGDKSRNAPDDVISERPGGPGKPVTP